MEAPKEIYLQQKKRSGLIDGYYNTPIWEDTHDNIKYIRADLAEKAKNEFHNKGYLEGRKNAHIPARELGLPKDCDNPNLAELTWEDVEKLDKIMGDVWHDGNFGDLHEGFYTEVLRRFNEAKQDEGK
jgi:hypothetical protein